MPATEKMHTENAESSFSVFFVCILQWPALSFVASNFGIEAYQSRFEILLVTEAGFVVSLIHLDVRLLVVSVTCKFLLCPVKTHIPGLSFVFRK